MTMNLSKSYDFFKPENIRERIHIIGCGSVGACVAELLARFGLTKLTLYDFDTVEPKNIANQLFRQEHVGMAKVAALTDMLCEINPEVRDTVKIEPEGYYSNQQLFGGAAFEGTTQDAELNIRTAQKLSGFVFLCVDNIDLRREIATANKDNPYIKAMFDFRTRLTDAQHYAADWNDLKMIDDFLRSMDFSHEEAKAETPVSACNVELSVAPTVRVICSLGVANFVNFTKGEVLRKFIQMDAFEFILDAF